MSQVYGVKALETRNVNQDALENMFGQIRDCGRRDINPTPKSFVSGFKTYLVNNIYRHSMGANCEDDGAECLLSDLKGLLLPTTPPDEVY